MVLAKMMGDYPESSMTNQEAAMKDRDGADSGTLRFVVPNFSKLKETVLSPPAYIRNLPWKIMVVPRTTYHKCIGITKTLGLFLQCNNGESGSLNWFCNATVELKLISQKEGVKNFSRKIPHRFCFYENDWGFGKFILWEELLDPEEGFIKDDTVILEAVVHTHHSHTDGPASAEEKLFASPSVSEDLIVLYNNQCLCDVILRTKSKSFPTHKAVLCARSPVFRAMMTNDMKEKHKSCIQIDDLDDDTVQQFLLFLYSDNVENLNWNTATQLYYAADKYEVDKLKQACYHFFVANINTSNAEELHHLADTHSDNILKEVAEDFLQYKQGICQSCKSRKVHKLGKQTRKSNRIRKQVTRFPKN